MPATDTTATEKTSIFTLKIIVSVVAVVSVTGMIWHDVNWDQDTFHYNTLSIYISIDRILRWDIEWKSLLIVKIRTFLTPVAYQTSAMFFLDWDRLGVCREGLMII